MEVESADGCYIVNDDIAFVQCILVKLAVVKIRVVAVVLLVGVWWQTGN